MNKRILCLLMTAVVLLAGCAKNTTPPQDPEDTMPTIETAKTPLEILTEAAEKTEDDPNVTAVYGRIMDGEEETEVSGDGFITNSDFLADFCALRITASPSKTGVMRYAIDGLTRDQLYALLYGESTGESALFDFSKVLCSIAIEVDEAGYLSRIEYTVKHYRTDPEPVSTETRYVQLEPAVPADNAHVPRQ